MAGAEGPRLRRGWRAAFPRQRPLREAADWILVSDCDEYVSLAEPLNGLPDLIRACPDGTDAIALPWRFFGNNGVRAYEDRPVTEQFLSQKNRQEKVL